MKLRQFIFIILLIAIGLQFGFGQEKPKAELIDKFGKLACEDLRIHISFFLEELSKDQNSKGYAVLYKAKNGKNPPYWFEKVVIGSIYVHGFNREIVKIVHGEERDYFEIELWKVPNGADNPKYLTESSTYKIPSPTPNKAFVLGIDAEDEMVCPYFSRRIYAEALKNNPNLKGHIVIFNSPKNQRKEIIDSFSVFLSKDNNIPRSQFDFFFAKDKRGWFFTEFWLVPKRRKS